MEMYKPFKNSVNVFVTILFMKNIETFLKKKYRAVEQNVNDSGRI